MTFRTCNLPCHSVAQMKCCVACSHTPGLIRILDSSCPDICPNSETFILYEIRAGIKKSVKFELFQYLCQLSMRGFWQTEWQWGRFCCAVCFPCQSSFSQCSIFIWHQSSDSGPSPRDSTSSHPMNKKERTICCEFYFDWFYCIAVFEVCVQLACFQQSINNTLCMPLHSFFIGSLSQSVSCTQADTSCHGECFSLQIAHKTPKVYL